MSYPACLHQPLDMDSADPSVGDRCPNGRKVFYAQERDSTSRKVSRSNVSTKLAPRQRDSELVVSGSRFVLQSVMFRQPRTSRDDRVFCWATGGHEALGDPCATRAHCVWRMEEDGACWLPTGELVVSCRSRGGWDDVGVAAPGWLQTEVVNCLSGLVTCSLAVVDG